MLRIFGGSNYLSLLLDNRSVDDAYSEPTGGSRLGFRRVIGLNIFGRRRAHRGSTFFGDALSVLVRLLVMRFYIFAQLQDV